jgi:quinol monooxygenase YgiN
MILIEGTFRCPPENLDRARKTMTAMIMASRAEHGCIDYAYAQDLIDPSLIRVTERWRDRDAVLKHFASPHMKLWRASWSNLGIGERNLRHYEAEIAPPD